ITNVEKNYSYFPNTFLFEYKRVSFDKYRKDFDKVLMHIFRGDTYLLNLTFRSEILTDLSLQEIFYIADSPYKLFVKNKFVCFSPEPFVQIKNGKIFSYPMKGTINADLPDAERILLNDAKEMAEHYTIVDLIRNDLSQVANNVRVERFRYIDTIRTNGKTLLQTSSEISGDLFIHDLGAIFEKIIPAGSVTGAPKQKTIEIIQAIEKKDRGFYTGVFGIFDGENLYSSVMIRFISQIGKKMYYHSGGGIVSHSIAKKEYREMIDKIYLPYSKE
ncbi:MAG TPA: aminodeoxychorismate synthase component I, partial [Bacteroidales bacterium]|nr:aminodeoxychorismate synthase component I [Bacteroidales bacterium]